MSLQGRATALQRVEAVLRRRPDVPSVPLSLNVHVEAGGM